MYINSYRYTTVAAGIYFFLIIFIFYIPLSFAFLHCHTYAKHLYLVSGHSTLTLMSPGMRVKWTIKGIGYLQQLDHRHARMHTHRTRPAVQRVKEAHVYSLTEGARWGELAQRGRSGRDVKNNRKDLPVREELRHLAPLLGPKQRREQCEANKGVGMRMKRKRELHKVH